MKWIVPGLASEPMMDPPWSTGIQVSESAELFLVLALFLAVLAGVYLIQRWIGDECPPV